MGSRTPRRAGDRRAGLGMRALGLLARLAYRLSRQRLLHLPLDVAVILLGAAAAAYGLASVFLLRRPPRSPLLLLALALWALASLAVRRRGFVLFRAEPASATSPSEGEGGAAQAQRGLTPFQPLAVRATGTFTVRDERRYYVEAPGELEATGLGERIVKVQVSPVSLLGLFPSPDDEWGWWYAFFRPEEVIAATPGVLYFGWSPRPALRIDLGHAGPPLYISFDDPAARDLAASDLR